MNNDVTLDEMWRYAGCSLGYEPDELHRLATDICHDLGVDIGEAEQSILWPLLERLFSLTKGQSVALIDALQSALVADEGPTECWKALGIELKAV